MANSVPYLSVTWEWNSNHRYRFYVFTGLGDCVRLFTVRFSNKDQSVYLSPSFIGATKGADFHLSIHESGIVNLTHADSSHRVKKNTQEAAPLRHVATFQLNQLELFEAATHEEFNNPKSGHNHVPIVGFGTSPIMLTTYCVEKGSDWSPPLLGNSHMVHYKSEMKGKNYNFEFVIWQDLEMPFGQGSMAVQFGGENDGFYGV
jgi:hypothetical protein